MADPVKREDLRWEQAMASMALAGVRPLKLSTATVGPASEGTYTVANKATKRLVVLRIAGVGTDIRFDLNATAGATSFPVLPSVYFVLEVEPGDILHLYNANASGIPVYLMEIR